MKAVSKPERELLQVLKKEYPFFKVIPQHPIKIGRTTLFLDFYLPQAKLAAEADGQQHDNYTPFFHKNVEGFESSQRRDSRKTEWCEENGITLIRFKSYESIDIRNFRQKVKESLANGREHL